MEWNELVLWISSLWLRNCTLNGVAFVCGSNVLLYCEKRHEYEGDSSIYVFACKFFLVNDFYFLTQNQHYSRNWFRNIFQWRTIIANYGPKNQFIHTCGMCTWLLVFYFDAFCYFAIGLASILTFSFSSSSDKNVLFHRFFAQNSFAFHSSAKCYNMHGYLNANTTLSIR